MFSIVLSFLFGVNLAFCASAPDDFCASYTQKIKLNCPQQNSGPVALKVHFWEDCYGYVGTRGTLDMLCGVVARSRNHQGHWMFYSIVCDKILCDILRSENIIEPQATRRLWSLRTHREGARSREGLAIISLPGSDYYLCGVIDTDTGGVNEHFFGEVQPGISLDRAKAREKAVTRSDVATFDDKGPTNFWWSTDEALCLSAERDPLCLSELEGFYVLYTHTVKSKPSASQGNEVAIADKKHFLEDAFSCVIRHSTYDMLRDVIKIIKCLNQVRQAKMMCYSVVCDKIFCDVLRQDGIIEPQGVVRQWFLEKRHVWRGSCEGLAFMHVPGSDDDLYGFVAEGKDSTAGFCDDIQQYRLHREKAKEKAKDLPQLAAFDALGPTNYWIIPAHLVPQITG